MTEEVEVETRQIYLIPTEGPDGMQNTEVAFLAFLNRTIMINWVFFCPGYNHRPRRDW